MTKIIYLRTSTKEQNPENQLSACQELSGSDALVYEDKQTAWKDTSRQGFDEVYKQIKQGKVSDLYVWDLDRLFRNRKRLIAFFQLCKAIKCHVHSTRQAWLESINTMPDPWNEIVFDLMLQIMGWLAEEESTKKSDRVKAAVRITDGQTTSYKGNKWGRKAISSQKRQVILLMRGQGSNLREIAKATGLSLGSVHKYIQEIDISELALNGSS